MATSYTSKAPKGSDRHRDARWFATALAVVLSALAVAAWAQVPPHAPGTVCFTPSFWCWAQPPGPPGSPCGCPSPRGWVTGMRG